MEWEPSINVGNWLVLSVVIMPTTSLAGLSMDLEILILRVEGMISRRSGRRRRREGRSFVLVLHYIRNVLMNMRRMLRDARRYHGGGGGGRGAAFLMLKIGTK